MKLLTKEIENKAKKYPIGSQEKTPLMERKVLVKYFNPYGVGTWIITEMSYNESTKDWLMFGLAELGYGYELGYVSFNELNELRVNVFGHKMPIERDLYTKDCLVKDLINEQDLM